MQKQFFLFRGLVREAKHWGDFPQHLTQVHAGSEVITIDIPGAGTLVHSKAPLSIQGMVEIMRQEYQQKVKDDHEQILIAVSLGGMIAAQWLKSYPQDFDKVVLINTSYGGVSPLFDRLKPKALAHVLQVPWMKGRQKEEHILRLVKNHAQGFKETLDLWEEIEKERPVSVENSVRQLLAAASFRIGNWKPEHDVLILASTQDRMVSVNCSRKIAQKWQAPIVEHPTGGHDLTSDDPQWVAEKINLLYQ